LWLYITADTVRNKKDSVPYKLIEQIEVKNAKEIKISFIPQWIDPNSTQTVFRRRTFKLDCTMIQNWQMEHYPFDNQILDITIYTINPIPWVSLDTTGMSYSHISDSTKFDIGNGWYFDKDSVHPSVDTLIGIFRNERRYSAIHYKIPLNQKNPGLLFIKLFLGMYVAFWVAFIALFIPVESEEPRFGLPVGGLFAAIGNKYIIESLLPVSTDFTLVDTLHSITIVFILLIIAYSAILIFLNNKKKDYELKKGKFFLFRSFGLIKIDFKKFNLFVIVLLSLAYLLTNLYFILRTLSQAS